MGGGLGLSENRKPVELLESHRALFEPLKAFTPTLKVQLVNQDPLELQFVVDLLPRDFMAGRVAEGYQRPQPKAYLHVKLESAPCLDQLALLALASRLILLNDGKLADKEMLYEQLKGWFGSPIAPNWSKTIVEATYFALENIQRNRKVTELLGVPAT